MKGVLAWRLRRAARKRKLLVDPVVELTVRTQCWQQLKSLYDLPVESEWKGWLLSGCTTNGVSGPPGNKLAGVSLGEPGDEAKFWPPKPATLHDYLFSIGGGLGRFRVANRIFRDYMRLYVPRLTDPKLWPWWHIEWKIELYAGVVDSTLGARHFNWRRSR